MKPSIDEKKLPLLLQTLAKIGLNSHGGIDRVAFSKADIEGRLWVAEQMERAGMSVYTDAAGNTVGRYPGRENARPPIVLGSHTDTVPNGGKFDGALGVLASVDCIHALNREKLHLRHPVEVINFAAEEATMAGGTFGSQAMTGKINLARLDKPAWDGRIVREHLKDAGLDPDNLAQAARGAGSVAAFLELHIEQGGILASSEIPIGIVDGIVGIRRYDVKFNGYANHAGTTPMDLRQDALVMAAAFILDVRGIAVHWGIVGTVGTVHVHPGAPNVIPGRVELSVEIRGLDEKMIENAEGDLKEKAEKAKADFERITYVKPVKSALLITETIIEACKELSLDYKIMGSGAGHDAMSMASIAPQAMLFVPSQKGISHSPDEFTDMENCILGANILLSALIKLDRKF